MNFNLLCLLGAFPDCSDFLTLRDTVLHCCFLANWISLTFKCAKVILKENNCTKKNIIPVGHSFISNAFLLFLVQNFLLRNQVL